jgi:CRP-like cAMP-binding protein
MPHKRVADYREMLRAGRWFRGLPEAFQDAIVSISFVKEVEPKVRLFARGDPGNGMYAVLDGKLRASSSDGAGKTALLTIVEPPNWVGELPIFDGLPRTHDLTAEAPALVVYVPQTPLLALLDQHPRWWSDMSLLLAGKLRLAFGAIEDSQLLPLPARLAHRLVLIAEGYGEWSDRSTRQVGVSQETLATMLATSRQTINQALKAMEAKGWVRLAYGCVEILDRNALRQSLEEAPYLP